MKHPHATTAISGLSLAALLCAAEAAAQSDRHDWSLSFDVTSVSPSTLLDSWVDGSIGKFRYGDGSDELGIGRAMFDYSGRIKPTLTAHITADYQDGVGGIDLTEAFLEWRPVPKSANRHQLRVGAFYPPISLEHPDRGWSNAYTINASAINTWIAEEVRTLGAEWRTSRALGPRAAGREMSFYGAMYFGNDPTGVLLVWKGWSLHDLQSRLNDAMPIPPVPQIQPGMMFEAQALKTEPFREVDDAPGFYFGMDWRLGPHVLVTAMHYDNHADPLEIRDGHYGWTTRFDHVGLQVDLPAGVGLVAQVMDGTTVMGPIMNGARVVDAGFESHFVMLTKKLDKHRLSIRYDDFEVIDYDEIPLDSNDETGDAWTLSYRYDYSDRLTVSVDWLEVSTVRPAWAYFGQTIDQTEIALQARVSYRLGTTR